jgi:hypothetical protein
MGIADMNLDGTADLLCDEGGLPDRFGWLEFSHGLPVRLHDLAAMPAAEWRLSGASRLNAFTRATGLLWRNRKTGDLSRWMIATDGLSVVGTSHLENGLVQSWELVSF